MNNRNELTGSARSGTWALSRTTGMRRFQGRRHVASGPHPFSPSELSTFNTQLSTAFSGTVVARYTYDPYGNILSMSGSLAEANLYRFSSKEAHVNSGLVYYLYRYYEPNLQRWINRDPIEEEGGVNLFTFSGNSPVGKVDLFGLVECWHHDFPREVFTREFLSQHGLKLNPDHKGNGRMLPQDMHQAIHPDWNDDWKDWVDDQKGKKITDKSIMEQRDRMLKDPRYKAIYKTGTRPKYNYNDTRRFRGLGLIAALAALVSESGNAQMAKHYEEFLKYYKEGELPMMDVTAGVLADDARSCGMPDSFANRIATDLPLAR